MNIEQVGVVAGLSLSVATLLGMGWRNMRKAGVAAQCVEQVPALVARMDEMAVNVSKVMGELSLNSGRPTLRTKVTEMHDLLIRMDERTQSTAARLEQHIGRCDHG